MRFLGPKPTQDPMNIVFEQKSLGKFFFETPGTPDRKKFGARPGRAGRAGLAGGPKVVQIIPLGSLTLLKRSATLKKGIFDTKYYVEIFCLAKVMPKTRFFWPPAGVFDPAETLQ